jgi:hypothetical protein
MALNDLKVREISKRAFLSSQGTLIGPITDLFSLGIPKVTTRLFDAIIAVDFSAAEGPKKGEGSVWIGIMKRDARFRPTYEDKNPATRLEAMTILKELLLDFKKRGEKVLIGFDFALGFPTGTSQKLGLELKAQDLWTFVTKNIVDKPDNTNNRFAVAAKMNRLMTDQAYPFWGCPKNAAQKWLSTLKPADFGSFPEYRLTEIVARQKKAPAKSLWQMHGAGVVGGQSLLGIAHIEGLKQTPTLKGQLWPFETGLKTLSADDLEYSDWVGCEIYPSLFEKIYEFTSNENEVKDQAQVRLVCESLTKLDDQGELGILFAGPSRLTESERYIVESEEGWILGLMD